MLLCYVYVVVVFMKEAAFRKVRVLMKWSSFSLSWNGLIMFSVVSIQYIIFNSKTYRISKILTSELFPICFAFSLVSLCMSRVRYLVSCFTFYHILKEISSSRYSFSREMIPDPNNPQSLFFTLAVAASEVILVLKI